MKISKSQASIHQTRDSFAKEQNSSKSYNLSSGLQILSLFVTLMFITVFSRAHH
jgi:hypothetical protein